MKQLLLTAAFLLSLTLSVQAQEITPDMQKQAREIVSKMTLDEKLNYINGERGFYIRAIPRLGLPEIRMADGPQGVRNDTHSTMYPAVICATATWNRNMAYAMGQGIGIDCRTRGVDMILGPGVNIYRSPLAGRCFEYTGEDPYLASETALNYVLGVQQNGALACIKHYAANNQEWDRNFVSSDVDERTMHEIYFPTFRKAVEKGHVAAIMDSYNLINNVWATENSWLNIDVARKMWGFKGVIMSDWGAVHDDIAPINGGMDLEMPGGALHAAPIKRALASGIITESQIDTMCQHIVQMVLAYREMPKNDIQQPEDNPANCGRALDIAREGITLLKNQNNALPLKGKTMVIGPNADQIVMGGGSGEVHPIHAVSLLQGLQTALEKKVFVGDTRDNWRHLDASYFSTKNGQGFDLEFFNNLELKGNAVGTLHTEKVAMEWTEAPVAGVGATNYSDRLTTTFTSKENCEVVFEFGGDDGYRCYIDGEIIGEDWHDHGTTLKTYKLKAVAGKSYNIVMEHYQAAGNSEIYFDAKVYDEANTKAPDYLAQFNKCDNIIVSIGWNKKLETEGGDHNFSLPEAQVQLVKEAAQHGKKVIVVLNAGGNPNIAEWADYADAILMAYYPGQEGGTALAEILTGKVNPSGKLPFTMEKRWEDNPSYANYYDKTHKDNLRIRYEEGIFVGYRGYDRNNTEVAFPFGYGLSYTTFEYSDLQIEKVGKNDVVVSFNVTNTGKVDGKEVCQVYVSDKECSVARPVKELKGFDKISLKKGETKRVSIKLDSESFSFYDVNNHSFVVEPGRFDIMVGGNSRDLPLTGSVTID